MKKFYLIGALLLASSSAAFAAEPHSLASFADACCETFAACCNLGMDCCP